MPVPHGARPDRWSPADAARATSLATVVFGVIVLHALWRQYLLFGDHVFDVGIFDQGQWLLSRFHTPFVTLRGLHLFADHSSYVMVLLAPLYWLWADYRMLMVVGVGCIASGGPLLHAVARRHGLAPWAATAMAVAYLANPVVLWQAWEDFHPEIVAVPCILGAYLLSRSERPWWALVPLLVLLSAKEDAAFVVVPLALLFVFEPRTRRVGLVAAGAGAAVAAMNFLVLLPHFSPTGDAVYTGRYSRFGTGLTDMAANAVLHPSRLGDALFTTTSAVYLGWVLVPLFLAVLAPRILLVGVPITLLNLVSEFGYQHEPRRHYTVYLITVVALAAAVGAARLSRATSDQRPVALAVTLMLLASVVAQPVLGPNRFGNIWGGTVPSGAATAVSDAISIIPDDAVVAADTYLSVHLAHRRQIYEFPNPWDRRNWGTGDVPAEPSPDIVEWVAVLHRSADHDAGVRARLDAVRAEGSFEVVHDDPLVIILRRR